MKPMIPINNTLTQQYEAKKTIENGFWTAVTGHIFNHSVGVRFRQTLLSVL